MTYAPKTSAPMTSAPKTSPSIAQSRPGWEKRARLRRPVLEITAGLHRGVRIEMRQRDYRIGSALSADIVLRDAGVEAEHAVLSIEHGRARLEAVAGAVELATGALAAGHGCHLRLPAEFRLGEATLRVNRSRRWPDREGAAPIDGLRSWLARWSRSLVCATVAVAGSLAFAAASLPGPELPGSAVSDPPVKIAALGDVGGLVAPAGRAAPEPPRITEVVQSLAMRIEAAGLTGLKVTATGDRPMVSGTVSRHEAEAWTAVLQWFDQTYGPQLPLGADVSVGDRRPAPALKLQALWLGARPYVIAADGVRYYQGSVLEGGWVLQEIGEDRALVAKNGESLALAYR
jgi:hypothetical protein